MEKSNPDILKELLANPGMSVDQEWCDTMAREYPYFTLPSALELERNANLADNPERKKILTQRIAINSASPEMLYRLTEPLGLLQAGFYPREESKEPATTEEVIDTFINNYGRNDSSETALLEKLIFNPTPDYAQLLSEEEERSLPGTHRHNRRFSGKPHKLVHPQKPRELRALPASGRNAGSRT